MPFCQYCGSQLSQADKFCCVCGCPVIGQQPSGNSFNDNNNYNLNKVDSQPGNPPVFSQMTGDASQSLQQSYPRQQVAPRYPEQKFSSQGAYYGNSFNTQTNEGSQQSSELKTKINPLDDEFHKKIWEYAKERGWIDAEQPEKEDLWLNIDGESYIFPLLNKDGSIYNEFTLIKGVTQFQKKHTDIVIQLILITAASSFVSRLSIESQKIGFKSFNYVTVNCTLPKELINDISFAFYISLKDMKKLGDQFIMEFNNQINQ